jgi:hypothetical protein
VADTCKKSARISGRISIIPDAVIDVVQVCKQWNRLHPRTSKLMDRVLTSLAEGVEKFVPLVNHTGRLAVGERRCTTVSVGDTFKNLRRYVKSLNFFECVPSDPYEHGYSMHQVFSADSGLSVQSAGCGILSSPDP